MREEATKRAGPWLVMAATAVALALRLYRLDFQTLWWDEGISLYLAAQDLQALVFAKDFALDLHPPLYHVLLAGWTALVGADVFSARALSALLGALNVPVLYLVMRRLAGPTAGLAASLLLAAAPVHVFYSQEVRMYTLMPLLATLSLLAMVALLQARTRRERGIATVGYVLATAAGLWTYYYIAFLVVAQNVFFVLHWFKQREGLRWWALAQLATLAIFLPWLAATVAMLVGTDYWTIADAAYGAGDLPTFLRTFGLAYAVGFSLVEPWSSRFATLYLVVGLVGVCVGWRRDWQGRALLLLCLALPVLLAYAVATQRAFVFPRFVLFAAVAAYGLVGLGVAILWRRARWLGAAALALLLWSSALGLSHHYATPRTAYASGDYLVLFEHLRGAALPTDLLLANQAWGAGYARGYLPEPLPTLSWTPPAWSRDRDLAVRQLQELLRRHGRIWLFTWSEGGRQQDDFVARALGELAVSRFVDQYGEFRLQLFAAAGAPGVSPPLSGRGDLFGGAVRLAGYEARPPASLRPGEALELTLVWVADGPVNDDYTVFTQLLGPDGRVYGQHDNPPVAASHPTSSWQTGEVVVDRHVLRLEPAAPPGRYRLIVGLYAPGTMKRLPITDGAGTVVADHVVLADLDCAP